MGALEAFLLVAGIIALVTGADALVRGASRLAVRGGVSPLVIGLTVVAFGTSAPELAVSLTSSWSGEADVAVGNVVGSNIFNVLFVLGASALLTPLVVDQRLVRREVPLLVAVSIVAWLLCLDGALGRAEGVLLVLGAVAYTAWTVRDSLLESRTVEREYEEAFGWPARAGLFGELVSLVAGLALLGVGSRWLVQGAVTLATAMGVSELVVGLTVVAAGTSLPEVATSLVAALKGERDIAVGNVIGSNLFNLLGVLGLSGVVAPEGLAVSAPALAFDLPVMIGAAIACLPILFTGHRIDRWEGGFFLAYYAAYVLWLTLGEVGSAWRAPYAAVMISFVVPLTVVTLAVLAVRATEARREA